MAGFPLWILAQSAKEGLSANKAYEEFHRAEGKLARGTFLQLYAQVREDLAGQANEPSRDLGSKPRAAEVNAYGTKSQSGYMQYTDVYVRDRATGEVFSVPYGIRTDDLLTRGDVVESALAAYGSHAERYGQQVLGATYSSTYLFAPVGEV
jgi:hypothetical protein